MIALDMYGLDKGLHLPGALGGHMGNPHAELLLRPLVAEWALQVSHHLGEPLDSQRHTDAWLVWGTILQDGLDLLCVEDLLSDACH